MNIVDELKILGSFEPGFMHIRLNTDLDLIDVLKNKSSNSSLSKEHQIVRSTFIHEYIHFLQDITTTTGLIYGCYYFDSIKDLIQRIITDSKNQFKIPISLNNKNNIKVNLDLLCFYRGSDKNFESVIYDNYSIKEEKFKINSGNIFSEEKYIVSVFDSKNQRSSSIHFGNRHLKEYVAHTLQSLYLPTVSHDDIPYLIVEKIVEKEYPYLLTNKYFLLALCDASLMGLNSAKLFFKTLSKMKEEKFEPINTNEVFDFTYAQLSNEGEKFNSLFDKYFDQLTDHYNDILKDSAFKPNLDWVLYLLKQGRELRLSNPNFITTLISNKYVMSDLFNKISLTLGTPLILNKKFQGFFSPPNLLPNKNEIAPEKMLVFKQVRKTFQGNVECILQSFCKNSGGSDITDNRCSSAPWLRVNDDFLCPLAQIWKTWGLKKSIPVKTI